MTQLLVSWKSENDLEALADYVFVIWPEWFYSHVNSMDMMTAQYAVMAGYEPAK